MDPDHASFSRALHLSELLDDLTVGRIGEEYDSGDSPDSGILLSRLEGNLDLFHSIH